MCSSCSVPNTVSDSGMGKGKQPLCSRVSPHWLLLRWKLLSTKTHGLTDWFLLKHFLYGSLQIFFFFILAALSFWVVHCERSCSFPVVGSSCVWLMLFYAENEISTPSSFLHIWLYFPAHLLVPMLAFLWSRNEGDEELAIQRAAPCPPPSSLFGVDGIPGVRSLGGCSAAAAPTAAQNPSCWTKPWYFFLQIFLLRKQLLAVFLRFAGQCTCVLAVNWDEFWSIFIRLYNCMI